MSTYLLRFLSKILLTFLSALIFNVFLLANQDAAYDHLIDVELKKQGSRYTTEKLASGFAGLAIGLYGYYNDDRGVLARIIYAVTQTAGILVIGNAIEERNTPNFFLITDKYIKNYEKSGVLATNEFKQELVRFKNFKENAEQKKLAYTSGILAALYFYTGFREGKENVAIRNIYYFLATNAMLISGANFYKAYITSPHDSLSLEMSAFPTISLVARF